LNFQQKEFTVKDYIVNNGGLTLKFESVSPQGLARLHEAVKALNKQELSQGLNQSPDLIVVTKSKLVKDAQRNSCYTVHIKVPYYGDTKGSVGGHGRIPIPQLFLLEIFQALQVFQLDDPEAEQE
jgi:hypothetical protein